MALGWMVAVFRQQDGGASPAAEEAGVVRPPLALWAAGLGGDHWLKELVDAGQAIALGGHGYPYSFTAQARVLLPVVREGSPPLLSEHWPLDDVDDEETVIEPADIPSNRFDGAAMEACRPDEWLLVKVFDQS